MSCSKALRHCNLSGLGLDSVGNSLTTKFPFSMASHIEFRTDAWTYCGRRELDESLIAPVSTLLPRTHHAASFSASSNKTASYSKAPDTYQARKSPNETTMNGVLSSYQDEPATTSFEALSTEGDWQEPRKRKYFSASRRREQCRVNQKRYRERKRAVKLKLEYEMEVLNHEISSLKRTRRENLSRGAMTHSPWSVVVDVFNLVETKLRSPWGEADTETSAGQADTKDMLLRLEKSFASDATMGNLHGTDKLLEQLRYYAQYFGDSKIRLKRVDELVPSVLVASAVFSFTISEITLFTVFPVLARALQERGSSQLKVIAKCLLGKRLDCSCLMAFYFDDETERVTRVETTIDWIDPLFSVLGNLDDVRRVLEDAIITQECIICP